jgi:hypothetical protein
MNLPTLKLNQMKLYICKPFIFMGFMNFLDLKMNLKIMTTDQEVWGSNPYRVTVLKGYIINLV